MAEEFTNIMKEFSMKSLDTKLNGITDLLDKSIRYFTSRIEQIESKIQLIEIKYLLNERKVANMEVVGQSDNMTELPLKPAKIPSRASIISELNGLFKKNKNKS